MITQSNPGVRRPRHAPHPIEQPWAGLIVSRDANSATYPAAQRRFTSISVSTGSVVYSEERAWTMQAPAQPAPVLPRQ